MAQFNYTAISGSNQRIFGMIRCHDRNDCLRQLKSRGCHPLEITESSEKSDGVTLIMQGLFQRVSVSNLATFTRQLSALLRAGLPMIKALATLRGQIYNKRLVSIIEDVEETVARDGGTLAEALEEHPRVFDAVYRGLVRAGEEGGKLVEVLGTLAIHLSKSARLRGQVIGAFIYPTFISFLGFAAVFVLMAFVIPQFKELFETVGNKMPLPTRILINASDFTAQWWWMILLILGFVLSLMIVILKRPSMRKRIDRRALDIPILGSMFVKLEISRISRTLGTLLNSGVGILTALKVTGETAKNRAIKETFSEMIKGVSSGKPVATVLENANLYPPLMINLVRTGEETGELPAMLMELAEIYEDEAERAVTNAVKLIEPLLIVIVGGVVASIVAAVMLPIFEANTMVS